jgi:PAS domain S-box-containing protein
MDLERSMPDSDEPSNPAFDRYADRLQRATAAWCALVGSAVLVIGWGFGVNWLKTVLPGAPYMRVNAAIGLVIVGAALWSKGSQRHFSAVAGGCVALIGVLTFIEYAFGVNLHVDELAIGDRMPPVRGWPPGRMALTTAICFSLLGSGLALSGYRRTISAIQWLAIPVAGLSLAALIGYLYGVPNIYGLACYMNMPVHVALTLLVAAIALLFASPQHGVMRNIMSRGPGGAIARRLLPAAILVPPLLGWLRWRGQQLGYYDTAFGLSIFAAANVFVFTVLIWLNAGILNRSDDRRKQAMRDLRASEEQFRALFEFTPDAMIVTDEEGRLILINAQAEALFGYVRADLLGEPVEKLIPHEARARHRDHRAAFAAAPRMRQMCALPVNLLGLRKDGGSLHVAVSLNSIRTPDGLRVVCIVRDLAACDMAETTLRESEARFRQLADAMPQIVWTADPDGNVDYHNQRWFDYTGQTPLESLNLGWQPVLHPDDLANCIARRTRAFTAGEAYEVEYRFRRAADGVYRWHLGRAIPIRNSDGAIVHWFGTCTDIDDYKRAEQEIRGAWLEIKSLNDTLERNVRERTLQLRDSQERFRSLVEGVKDYAILLLDSQGRVASWTDAAERLLRYSGAEILGTGFSRFHTAEDLERGHPEEVLEAAARNGRFEEQGWRVRKDGSRFWAEVLITAMRDETGRLRGFSKITRDITERKRSEEQIRQSEEKFRALLESAPDAVVIADGQANIVLINAQAERMFGYERQKMVGQPVDMLLTTRARADDAPRGETYKGSARSLRMGIGMQLNGLRKNGAEFPVEVSLSPIKTSEGTSVAAAIRDISERKLAERQLIIARQRAEEANRAKSDFLAAMSHEIRTPMNAILGMSELLAETNLNDAQRQYVQVFRRAGSSLLNLINDILDFSKIEAGRFDLEQTEFQLRDLVDQTVELVAPKAHAKGIAVASRLTPNLPDRFAGDAGRLRQVLTNLLGNAIKFTDTGEVVLAVDEPPAGPAGHLEFSVSDTGIGIPEEQLETIFEDFKQGDCSTTRKYGGTGLGLAISRRIVERMGGTLTVASQVGEGSTFRFSLPLQPTPERREEPPEILDFHGHRVAIIDRNATNRLNLLETLGGCGLEIQEYTSSEEALIHLIGMPPGPCPYSLVFIDTQVDSQADGGLSPSNGFVTAARIREIFPALPVVMLSSNDCPGEEARCRESGYAGYARRPVSRAGLLQLISKALECSCTAVSGPAARPEPEGSRGIANRGCLRVLVAEDSPDNRLLLELYMTSGHHSLTFVENGWEAVGQIAAGEFDLVLMDLQMPVMDGLTATRAVRAMELEKGSRAVPILALSANARPEDIESSLEAGCTEHLSKPISKRRLLAALDEYTRGLPAGKLS